MWGGGYGAPGGFGAPGFGGGFGAPGYGGGFGGPGMINLGGGGAFSYTGGPWGAMHDQQLMAQIEYIFQKYDRNFSGQIDGGEFFMAYQELCMLTGQPAPQDFYSIQMIARQTDTNFDGRISRQEMFALFKRAQFGMW